MAEKDLLEVLLDRDCKEPVSLMDANGNILEFEQVAIIPHEMRLYCILKPLTQIKGLELEDDMAMVFRVEVDENGDSGLIMEENQAIATQVFSQYELLLKKENK